MDCTVGEFTCGLWNEAGILDSRPPVSLSPSSTIFFLRALMHRFPFMTRANNFSFKVVGVDTQTRVNVDKNDINMYIVFKT